MKKLLITVAFLFLGSITLVRAQMNVGSASAPDPSSILQLSSSNQGLRLPNVSLTSTTTFGLVGSSSAATIGMQVYNTNASIASANALYPISHGGIGVYIWDGTGWKSAAASSDLPLMLEIHATFSSATTITRGGAGTMTALTNGASGNTTTLVSSINTIPNATFTPGTGDISLPAGTYLFTVTYVLVATSGNGTQPAVHAFYYDFPADDNAMRNGNSTRFEATQDSNNPSTGVGNPLGFSITYMPILTQTHTCTFGIGWGSNNVNLPSPIAYNGSVSFSIIKLK